MNKWLFGEDYSLDMDDQLESIIRHNEEKDEELNRNWLRVVCSSVDRKRLQMRKTVVIQIVAEGFSLRAADRRSADDTSKRLYYQNAEAF